MKGDLIRAQMAIGCAFCTEEVFVLNRAPIERLALRRQESLVRALTGQAKFTSEPCDWLCGRNHQRYWLPL